jgi:hypothetical protein
MKIGDCPLLNQFYGANNMHARRKEIYYCGLRSDLDRTMA